MVLLELISPLFDENKDKPYLQRLEKHASQGEKLLSGKPDKKPDMKSLFFKLFERVALMFGLSIFFLIGVSGLGGVWAKDQSSFYVIQNEDTVVLRKYGDYLIVKKLNRETNSLGKEVLIFKIKDEEKLSIKLEKLGELKVEK